MPAPEYFQAYYFKCASQESLAGVIDALRPLRMDGTIRSSSHIANDYKVLSALQQYPWQEMDGRTPLDPAHMQRFHKELRIGAWNGSGALYGTRAQVGEARRLLRCSPVAPNQGCHAERITGLAGEIMLRHGFEPMISLTVLTDRTLSCIISLGYDRHAPGEDQKAMTCYRELLDRLAIDGYYSY